MYNAVFRSTFVDQFNELSYDTQERIKEKIELACNNPKHFKRIRHSKHILFSIKFTDKRSEKRLIYLIKDETIYLLFILDRKNDYKDLEKELQKIGY